MSADTSSEAIDAECKNLAQLLGLGALTAIAQLRALAQERDDETLRADANLAAHEAAMRSLKMVEAERDAARAEAERLAKIVRRYLNETPLGHQPHMLAHEARAALAAKENEQ